MFDIGALEILVVAVVALLIVGPEEFPYLLRSVGRTLGKIRRMIGSVRDQFESEIEKTEKIREKMQEELRISNLHEKIEAGAEAVSGLSKSVPAASSQPRPESTSKEHKAPEGQSATQAGDEKDSSHATSKPSEPT